MESEERPEGEKAEGRGKPKPKKSRKRKEPKPPLQADMPLDESMPATSMPGLPALPLPAFPAAGGIKAGGPDQPAPGGKPGTVEGGKGGAGKGARKSGAWKPTRVSEIMTEDPVCCTPETPLVRVARMMAENSCGAIPVIRNPEDRVPVGIITDRDLVVRSVALGRNPLEMTAGDVLTDSPVTVHPEDSVEDCAAAMRGYKLRRIVVVDGSGRVRGLVVQAQIARYLPREESGEIVRDISQPPL